jgi:hypothetical protein
MPNKLQQYQMGNGKIVQSSARSSDVNIKDINVQEIVKLARAKRQREKTAGLAGYLVPALGALGLAGLGAYGINKGINTVTGAINNANPGLAPAPKAPAQPVAPKPMNPFANLFGGK